MNPTDRIHMSWDPIRHILYEEPLTTLQQNILPNISYRPRDPHNIFRAFTLPVNKINVVILGQDPYPMGDQACGLAFVNGTDKTPKSLKVIYNEILDTIPDSPCDARSWKDQSVFLLNTALTVEVGRPNSHKNYWNSFTASAVRYLSRVSSCIWLLWGSNAQYYKRFIHSRQNMDGYDRSTINDAPIHPDYNYVFTAGHPASEGYNSTNTRKFYGCDHFYLTNQVLQSQGKPKIIW